MKLLVIVLMFLASACSPAAISRIGPTIPARSEDCDVEILEEGAIPNRPYRDVGMVSLSNCQDYRTEPCLSWLRKAACKLGGHVAYSSTQSQPVNQTGHVTFKLMVAAYVADLRPDISGDPYLESRNCNPPCKSGERCENKVCVSVTSNDCEDLSEDASANEDSIEPQKCMD